MIAINKRRTRGVYVVEFAIIGLLLFTLLFGVLEMGRLYFTVNSLDEVVRRGARLAAVCQISDPVVLHRAIFNDAGDASSSSLIGNLEVAHLTLTYLDKDGAPVVNPDDISYVQLSVNDPLNSNKFTFNLLIPGFGGVFTLPVFRSTLPRESLGRHADDMPPEITPC